MDQFTKMILFAIAVVFMAMMFAGLHASPKASPETGAQRNKSFTPSSIGSESESYPSDDHPY